ncbi:hypothetical protein LINGRAHAP2_LOCUS35652 [Linum grandiflorum]
MSPNFPYCLVLLLIATSSATSAVDFQVINNSPTTKGGARFANEIGPNYTRNKMSEATDFIWRDIFRQCTPSDRRTYQQVKLFVNTFNATKVAYTGGGNEIYFSAEYLENYSGGALRKEFTGVMYREMARVWQWTGGGSGQANVGLLDGVANYVRMKADLVAESGWVKLGGGDRWDQGGDVTARFLEYCDGLRKGFVGDLNGRMKASYSVGYFEELLGKNVEDVWRQYKKKYSWMLSH